MNENAEIADEERMRQELLEQARTKMAWIKKTDSKLIQEKIMKRAVRAEEIIKQGKIWRINKTDFLVENGRGYLYYVKLSKGKKKAFCTCKDFQKHWHVIGDKKVIVTVCKHVLAAMLISNDKHY